MAAWRQAPGPARSIGLAIGAAVDAAGARDRTAYVEATTRLAELPAEQTGEVLGALVRSLLEEQHPDGLDRDDIQAVLSRCLGQAAGWLPVRAIEPSTLIAVLAGALGIHEAGVTYEEQGVPATGTVPTPTGYAWHAPLLIADLLASGRRTLDRYLDAAFAEIYRAETMELP